MLRLHAYPFNGPSREHSMTPAAVAHLATFRRPALRSGSNRAHAREQLRLYPMAHVRRIRLER